MKAGKYLDRIKAQSRTTQNTATGERGDFVDVAGSEQQAQIVYQKGSEATGAVSENFNLVLQVNTRYCLALAGLEPNDRLINTRTNEIIDIMAVVPNVQKKEIVFYGEIKGR